jgi:hypothetical protein
MTKIYFSILCCILFSTHAFSQKLIPLPGDSASTSASVTDGYQPYDIHIEVVNNTANTITATWGLMNYTAPQGWEVKLCDNRNCYDLLISGGPYISDTVSAGDTLDMKFQYTSHCIAGTGQTNVYLHITHDSVQSNLVLNYKADLSSACTNAINELPVNKLNVYPNPVENSVFVTCADAALNTTYVIYDLTGAAVKSETKNVTNTGAEISMSGLAAGTYVLKAVNGQGRVTGIAKLNKVE